MDKSQGWESWKKNKLFLLVVVQLGGGGALSSRLWLALRLRGAEARGGAQRHRTTPEEETKEHHDFVVMG
jgi:hypothetical protein